MSELPIWAKDRAREWLGDVLRPDERHIGDRSEPSLAALLVEVSKEAWIKGCKADQQALLAEVRRVVESTVGIAHPQRESSPG